MAETWLDKCESFSKNIDNGNHLDARRLLQSFSRKQRYQAIAYIKGYVTDEVLWRYIKVCIEGDFT